MYTTAEYTVSAVIITQSLGGGGASHFSLEERDSGKGQTIPNTSSVTLW